MRKIIIRLGLLSSITIFCAFSLGGCAQTPEASVSQIKEITGELEVWPPVGSQIPLDAAILLEGSGSFAEMMPSIAERGSLHYQGGELKLKLLALGSAGHTGRHQALVQALQPLLPNTEYTLRLTVEGRPDDPPYPLRVRVTGGSRDTAHWSTSSTPAERSGATVPAFVGELGIVIACGAYEATNVFNLSGRLNHSEPFTFARVRVSRVQPGQLEATTPPFLECISRVSQGSQGRADFATCSIPASLRSGRLQIELSPLSASGVLGKSVQITR